MSDASLTLVSHHLCPYVQRAAIALSEKGVGFERVNIDLPNKPDWFVDISPLGKVPLLIVRRRDGPDAILFESAAICEYLEETQAGPPLHPQDPLDRARHRGWIEFGSSILSDIYGLETAKGAEAHEAKVETLKLKFARLDMVLEDGPFFSGDAFALVDAVFAPVFRYFDVFDEIVGLGIFDDLHRVQAWRRNLARRRSVIDAVGDDYPDRLRGFLKDHQAWMLRLRTQASVDD